MTAHNLSLNRMNEVQSIEHGYNEHLGTGHFCSLSPGLVITGLFVNHLSKKLVHYIRVYANHRVCVRESE
jgi:hypothetical protein